MKVLQTTALIAVALLSSTADARFGGWGWFSSFGPHKPHRPHRPWHRPDSTEEEPTGEDSTEEDDDKPCHSTTNPCKENYVCTTGRHGNYCKLQDSIPCADDRDCTNDNCWKADGAVFGYCNGCKENADCPDGTGTCMVPHRADFGTCVACTYDNQTACGDGKYCQYRECIDKKADGEKCYKDVECQSGDCAEDDTEEDERKGWGRRRKWHSRKCKASS